MSTISSTKKSWPSFVKKCDDTGSRPARQTLKTLQINLGKLCNQVCLHCHVDAGPNKTRENMTRETAERIVELATACPSLKVVDLTGGAPELNPNFRYLVESFRKLGIRVIDRCNLTVLFTKGQESTAAFLAEHGVAVVASLPCYSSENVNKQRGDGVFQSSIEGLKELNRLGYGDEDSLLTLDLVYNPIGPNLPPSQSDLEAEYKRRLLNDFGIRFNNLFTITNMPIKRFLYDLKKSNKYHDYMELLAQSFNEQAAENVMCRSLVSISWDGQFYDCDFNQMLDLPAKVTDKNIFEISSLEVFSAGDIRLENHCYGCTAGAGSSCSGALKD